MGEPLLAVRDLKTHFFNADGVTRAVDDVSFDIAPSETLGIVGESGCGKSVTALSVLRLLPSRRGAPSAARSGSRASDLLKLDEPAMRAMRGNRIAMIFQEPMTSLNPLLTVGAQIAEALRAAPGNRPRRRRRTGGRDARLVRIPEPSAASATIRTNSPAACASA